MEYNAEKREIKIDKVLNELDKFTINFLDILEKHVKYVIVSGYVSILLGRSRASEDVDILAAKMELPEFKVLFDDLWNKGYECANTSDSTEAFSMLSEHAIAFYRKIPVPHIDFKFINTEIQREAFEDRIKAVLGEKHLYISPLELQIVYKLSLMSDADLRDISSDKDFEDAKHLYEVFKQKLNKDKLLYYVKHFKVQRKFEILENG